MKTILQLRTAAALLILIASMASVPAQPTPQSAPVVNPVTGLPVTPPAPAEPQWISPDWKDPDIVLTNVSFDHLPISEVARSLRENFKDYFDVLLPGSDDPGVQTIVVLQLEHVKASEVFNAMNMLFQNDRMPLRWELKMNYSRPTVQLRVLPGAAPKAAPEFIERIYFVGDLLGDEKSGGMTMRQLSQALRDIWGKASPGDNGVIQFYEPAQLLIYRGTPAQVDFVQQTLSALRQKVSFEHNKSADLQNKTEGPNSAGAK